MISHVDHKEIEGLLSTMKEIYGVYLAKKTGNTHNYLGMVFDYSVDGEVHINMGHYLIGDYGSVSYTGK
jgi:hypothetical protein